MYFLNLKRAPIIFCLSMALGGSASPTADNSGVIPVKAGVSARDLHVSGTKRDVQCVNISGNEISEINASGCVDVLLDSEDDECSATGTDMVMFEQIGDAAIFGINALGTGTAATTCGDVAATARNIINTCTNPDTGLLQGRAPTTGNPNLIVVIDSSHSSVPPCNPCF